jgi:hypothetical protein
LLPEAPTPRVSRPSTLQRRNRCEFAVREILGDDPALYVHRSRLDESTPDGTRRVVITLIARDQAGRDRARHLLNEFAGFPAEEWDQRWVPLNLGDALIRIYPEGALRES